MSWRWKTAVFHGLPVANYLAYYDISTPVSLRALRRSRRDTVVVVAAVVVRRFLDGRLAEKMGVGRVVAGAGSGGRKTPRNDLLFGGGGIAPRSLVFLPIGSELKAGCML